MSMDKSWIIFFVGVLFGAILLAVALYADIIFKDAPEAMDVYRGETVLEITYRDSIPIDSTVVWKDKK